MLRVRATFPSNAALSWLRKIASAGSLRSAFMREAVTEPKPQAR